MLKKALVGALEVLEKPLVTCWESIGNVLEFTFEWNSISVRFPTRGHKFRPLEQFILLKDGQQFKS